MSIAIPDWSDIFTPETRLDGEFYINMPKYRYIRFLIMFRSIAKESYRVIFKDGKFTICCSEIAMYRLVDHLGKSGYKIASEEVSNGKYSFALTLGYFSGEVKEIKIL